MPFDDDAHRPEKDGNPDPSHDPEKIVALVNATVTTIKQQLRELKVCRTCAITNIVFNVSLQLAELNAEDEDSVLSKLHEAVELGVGVAMAKRRYQKGELH